MLCHRIVSEYYLLIEEYENTVNISRNGKKLIAAESLRTGLPFQKYHILSSIAYTANLFFLGTQTP